MKKIKRLLVLALALSMIMGAIPVYAVEDVPEAGEAAAGAKAGEAPPALEAAGTASEPGADEIGAEPQEQADTGSIEIPDDTEVTGTILQDAMVNVYPGNENKIWVNDQYLSDALLMGNNFYTFFRLDLNNYGGMKFEYAKIRLYNKKGVGNTVVYDKAIVPSGKDLWTADTLVTANMPSWEDETNPKYKATIPGTKDFAEIDVTALVNEAVEAGEETLEIKVGEKNASTSPAEVSSSKYADESKRPSLVLKREHVLSDEEKVAKVIGEIEKLNGIYLSEKVPFPFDAFQDEGVTVTWTSSNPAVVSTDGTIHQAEVGNVGVEITAVVSSGSVSQSTSVSVTVLRKQQVSPYARESLEKLIQYTEDSMKDAKEGEKTGNYSTEKGDALREILKDAKAALAARGQDNAYAAHCSNIISAGTEYFGSGKISDKVVKNSADNNGNGNLLEYSSYRAKLVSLVWAAEAQILVEPQMYSEAAKEALKEEIRLAKKVLDGTYAFPYSRSREFITPRDDEAIQYTTKYNVMMHNYGMSNYGLEPALSWYKSQNIAAESFITMELEPVYATYVHHHSSERESEYGNNVKEILVGVLDTDRMGLLQFDLSRIPGDIVSSQLRIANKNNGGQMSLNLEDDNWDGNHISAAEYEKNNNAQMHSKQQLVEFTIGNPTVLDVTDAVVGQSAGDQKISFSISAVNLTFPTAIYGNHADVDESLRPKLTVIVASADDTRLQEKYEEVTGLVTAFLDGAKAGNATGQYPEECLTAVRKAYEDAQSLYNSKADVYTLGAAMVAAENAVRDARNNRSLKLGNDENLFLDQSDIEALKKNTEDVQELKEVREKVLKTADSHQSDELKKIYEMVTKDDIEGLNKAGYKVWSEARSINFTSPAGTKKAWMEVRLSKEDHEKAGCGHAWLDNLQLVPTKSEDPKIPNAGFEEKGKGWTFVEGQNTKGEFSTEYAYEGKGSLYIENTDADAAGYWRSDVFPMEQDGYELRFRGKYDDKFKGLGLIMVVHYLDENGNPLKNDKGEELTSKELGRNTKSALVLDTGYASGYQAAALAYTLTGDEEYAKRSFWYMMLFLDDHLQGIEHWTVTSKRPDDFDYYGAVQEGRNANTLATAYSLIKSADIFGGDKALEEDYYNKVNTLIRDLLDLRDRTEMTPEDAAANSNNWHTDMSIGAAMLAMAFYEQIPNAQQYIDNGKYIVEGQLSASIREDGSWPESIRYHMSALTKMALFAKGLRHVTGEDWFGEGGTVTKMLKFLVQVQAPAYVNGYIGTPTIGDDTLSGGGLFSVLGWYWDEVVENDPELGQQMYETWVKAGRPTGTFGNEDNILQNFFLNPDFEDEYEWNKEYELKLTSSDYTRPYGLYQLRSNYGTPNETYLAFVANEKALGHNHYDQLSFSMYYHSIPLVVDPGIESYFSSSKGTYISTGSHATVQFSNSKNEFVNIGIESYDPGFTAGELLDRVKATTNAGVNGAAGILTRTIAYGRSGQEIFAIWDQVDGAANPTRWNLPVSAQEVNIIDNNRVDVKGFDDVGMTVLVLEGHSSIEKDQIRGAGSLPIKDGAGSPLVDIIRANSAEPNSDYLTVLLPYAGAPAEISYEKAETDSGILAYWINAGDERYLVAANATGADQAVGIGETSMIRLLDGKQVTGSAAAPNGELTIYKVGSIDRTKLEELVKTAQALDLTKYEEAGKAEFEAALAAAEAGLASEAAGQDEIDRLYAELKARMDALVLIKQNPGTPDTPDNPNTPDTPDNPNTPDTPDNPNTPDTPDNPNTSDKTDKVDKTALKELVEKAKAIDLAKYQEIGKVEFRTALAAAEEGLMNDSLSQSEVDALYQALKKAMDNLKPLSESPAAGSNKDSKKDEGKSPRTGDNADILLYASIALLAMITILSIYGKKYRRRS